MNIIYSVNIRHGRFRYSTTTSETPTTKRVAAVRGCDDRDAGLDADSETQQQITTTNPHLLAKYSDEDVDSMIDGYSAMVSLCGAIDIKDSPNLKTELKNCLIHNISPAMALLVCTAKYAIKKRGYLVCVEKVIDPHSDEVPNAEQSTE